MGPDNGIAAVYIDGQLDRLVDTYSADEMANIAVYADALLRGDEQRQVPLFTRQWPTSGHHALRFVIRPDSNMWATGRAVHIDALHLAR